MRRLSDAELVIAQGRENLERRDLSYIERAQFAAALEAQGFDRATILAAVEPNKGNLSVMLSIANAVPAPYHRRDRSRAEGRPSALE